MGWQPQGPGQIPGYLIAFCLPEFLRRFPLGVLVSASCPESRHSAAGAGSPQAWSWEPAGRCWLDWKLIVFQPCEETASAAPAEELPVPKAGLCLAAPLLAAHLTAAQGKQLRCEQGNRTRQAYRKGRRIRAFLNPSQWPRRAILLWMCVAVKLGTAASRSPPSALLPDVPGRPRDRQRRVRPRDEGV